MQSLHHFCHLLDIESIDRIRLQVIVSVSEEGGICDLCLSKAAILKLWRYLRSTDSPNFFTPSEGLLRVTVFC